MIVVRVLLALLMATPALAANMALVWDCTGDCATATGTHVYRAPNMDCTGPLTRLTTNPIPIATKTYQDMNLAPGPYCWQTRAVNSLGEEGPPSNPYAYQVPNVPGPPTNLRGELVP